MSTRIEIETDDGAAPAFLFGDAKAPRALLLIDGLGMRPAMHELAEQLAGAGFHVLMPDVFYRLGAYTPPDPKAVFSDRTVWAAWWRRHQNINTAEKLMRDLHFFLAYFGGVPCGVVGYCMGGRLALTAAATYPDRIAAAAAYHPGGLVTDAPDSPHLGYGAIRAKVYIGAASEDANFTDAQRQTVEDTLRAAKVDHQVELYPARHGWVPSDIPVHDAACAARHWETLLALFRSALS